MSEQQLKILSGGAVKRGVGQVAKAFEQRTGTRVTVEFDTAPQIRKRVAAGGRADVFVVPPALMDELQEQGIIVPESRALVGRSRVGVVVHADAAAPRELAGSLTSDAAKRIFAASGID